MSTSLPVASSDLRRRLAAEDWSLRAWLALLRDLYLTFDRRTLGLCRIFLGFLLLTDLVHRGAAWSDMFSSVGVAPTVLHLQRPSSGSAFTIFNGFSSPGELHVLFALAFAVHLCLLVGYCTRVMQVVALVLVTGMNSRVGLVGNGGYVVNSLLVMWTCFLPLGDRFSVDALIASLRRRRETTAAALNDRQDPVRDDTRYVSAAGLAITLQLWAIYYFNVIHKTGSQWHDGTAVHYVLYVDRRVTPIVALVRDHLPNFLVLSMTRTTMLFESALPFLLLMPVARVWSRRAVVVLIIALHLAFGIALQLGPFAWSLCVFATLFVSPEDWEIAAATMRRPRRARTVLFDPRSGGALFACRLLERLDRFELLTFTAEEGLPSGIAVQGSGPGLRAGALAEIVEALPLGPCVAWIPRLPGVRAIVDAALAALEKRDLSAFFGLRVEGRAVASEVVSPAPRIPAGVVVLSVLAVAGAVAGAVVLDRPLPGVAIVVAAVALTGAVATWWVLPVVTVGALRRGVFGTLREALVLAMLAGAVDQACVELWAINKRIKVPQPEALRLLSHKLWLLQGWFMFCPVPEMDDGTIVVDALTVDGRHIDPFSGKAPNFDLENAKSLLLSQIWGDYFNRIQTSAWAGYRDAMKEYMLRFPERTGHPEDALVSGDVFWIHDQNPRWGQTRSYGFEQTKVFSFENPAAKRAVR